MKGPETWVDTLKRRVRHSQGVSLQNGLKKIGTGPLDPPTLAAIQNQLDVRIPEMVWENSGEKALSNQFVPTAQELVVNPQELDDPIGDNAFAVLPGLIHRYRDRVLMHVTYQCPVFCRFCFRREKVSHRPPAITEMEPYVEYLQKHPEVWEVILSGGDPLVLTDTRLAFFLDALKTIENIQIIRIHTRALTTLPGRFTPELFQTLKRSGKTMWIAIHANSHWEFTEESRRAIAQCHAHGVHLVLQSVLLKGVNDSVEALTQLFKTATVLGIKPYAIHYPDLAKGTEHFRVPLNQAVKLMQGLQGNISGPCIPKLVVDVPCGKGKVPVDLNYSKPIDENTWDFTSPLTHETLRVRYPDHGTSPTSAQKQ